MCKAIKCIHCSKIFKPKRADQQYCSTVCTNRASSKRTNNKKQLLRWLCDGWIKPHKCLICSNVFIRDNKHTLYCSDPCKQVGAARSRKKAIEKYRKTEKYKITIKEYSKKYYENYREDVLLKKKRWAIDNPDKVKEYSRKYSQDNREQITERRRHYRWESQGYEGELLEIKELQHKIKKEIKKQQENN